MALGSTQPLVKMNTRNISWRWRRPVHGADNLNTIVCRMSWKSGSLNLLEPSGPHRACYGIPLPFFNPLCGWGPTICEYRKPKYIRGRFTLLSGYNSFSRRGNILVPSNLHLSYLRNGRLILGRACYGRELPIRGWMWVCSNSTICLSDLWQVTSRNRWAEFIFQFEVPIISFIRLIYHFSL